MSVKTTAGWRLGLLALVVALLAACGGGGGSNGPVASTPLPTTLAADVPATAEVGAPVALKTTPSPVAADLVYDWDFGDGTRSAAAQPSHLYSTTGRYAWRVSIRNGYGQTVSANGTLQVGWFNRLAGANCSGAGTSGWCWQAAAQGALATTAHCADALHCVAAGELGQVAYTRDGGRSWALSRVPSGPESISLVRMADANTAYAFGGIQGNTVFRSRDGGQTWVLASRPATPLFANAFAAAGRAWTIDAQTLLASGAISQLSRDGGSSWTTLPFLVSEVTANGFLWADNGLSFSSDLGSTVRPVASGSVGDGRARLVLSRLAVDPRDIRVFVQENLPAGSSPVRRHLLLRSFDGGLGFVETMVSLPALPESAFISAMVLRADGSGDALANTYRGPAWRLRTSDGGLSWTAEALALGAGLGLDLAKLTSDGGAFVLRVLDLAQDPTGATGHLELLDLASNTRTAVDVPGAAFAQQGLDRVTANLVLGRQGNTITTISTDQGRSWSPLPAAGVSSPGVVLGSLLFFDVMQGLSAGITRFNSAVTSDGGRSWQTLGAGGPAIGHVDLRRLADGSVLRTTPGVSRSTDRGQTWTALPGPLGNADAAMYFLDGERGWAPGCRAGFNPCDPLLWRTTDGGKTWAEVASLPAYATLAFSSAMNGVGVGVAGTDVWWTTDGGARWTRSTLTDAQGNPDDVSSLSRLRIDSTGTGWMLGQRAGRDVVLRSNDGGQTWRVLAVPLPLLPSSPNPVRGLTDLFSLDGRHVWAVGTGGTVLASSDGGDTWRVQNSGTSLDLDGVFALDPQTVWFSAGFSSVSFTSSTGGDAR